MKATLGWRPKCETSIAIEPLPESWHDFGELMLKFGEDGLATDAFRKGLELSYGASDAPRLENKQSLVADD